MKEKEIVDWIVKVEALAARVYGRAAEHFSEDKKFSAFVRHMADEEADHHDLITRAFAASGEGIGRGALVYIDGETSKEIERRFLECERLIEEGVLTKEGLVDLMVATEFSEWNDIFLYAINTMLRSSGEFRRAAGAIQRHKKHLEVLVESSPEFARYSGAIKSIPDILTERILVVDDERLITDLLEAILAGAGVVDTASNGVEGLMKLGERYYAAIVTDYDMPVMDGKAFYERAVEKFPSAKGRFIFFSGSIDGERRAFCEKNGIKYLPKPSRAQEIRKAVLELLT